MRKKSVKKLKKLAAAIGVNATQEEKKRILRRLKKVHKSNKGEI